MTAKRNKHEKTPKKHGGGRKSAYDTIIKPNFAEIAKLLEIGTLEKDICERLGITTSTWHKYKSTKTEFNTFIKECRKKPVDQIKHAMMKSAIGYQYVEKTIIKRDGEIVEEKEVIKTQPPSNTAQMMLLRHWAKDEEWTADPARLKLQKEELELKKKHIEQENW